MRAQMVAVGANGRPQPMRKSDDMLKLASLLAGQKAEAERIKSIVGQFKKKEEVVKVFPELKEEKSYDAIAARAEKGVRRASSLAKTSLAYTEIIENLTDLNIPFLIFFDMEGHRIKLAESPLEKFRPKDKK